MIAFTSVANDEASRRASSNQESFHPRNESPHRCEKKSRAKKKSVDVIFIVIIAICQSRILNIYAYFRFDFRVMIAMFVCEVFAEFFALWVTAVGAKIGCWMSCELERAKRSGALCLLAWFVACFVLRNSGKIDFRKNTATQFVGKLFAMEIARHMKGD